VFPKRALTVKLTRGVHGQNLLDWPENCLKQVSISRVSSSNFGDLLRLNVTDAIIYNRKKDVGSVTGEWFKELLKTEPWYKDLFPDFRILPQNELPPGIDSATSFTSVCINTALYLPWLASKCLRNGATIRRAIVNHVSDAADLHHSGARADVVVNCTGLSSAKLGGVEDTTVFPARGQIVVVRNDPGIMTSVSGTDDGSDEATYIMHRAAGKSCAFQFARSKSKSSRRRHCARRVLSERQLGISNRSRSRFPNHETLRGLMSGTHGRKRAIKYNKTWSRVETCT